MTTPLLAPLLARLVRWTENLLAALLVAMVALVLGNVVLRYGFDSGIVISEELSRFLFIWLVFLGAVLAAGDDSHLAMDGLLERLPRPLRLACRAARHLLVLLCCWLILSGGWAQRGFNLDTAAPVTGIPMIWVYGAGFVTGAGIGLITLLRLWQTLRGQEAHRTDAQGTEGLQ